MNPKIYDELMKLKASGEYRALLQHIDDLNARAKLLDDRAAKFLAKPDGQPKFDLFDAIRYANYHLGGDISISVDRKFDSIYVRISDFSAATTFASQLTINERELIDHNVGVLNHRFEDAVLAIKREKEQC